MYELNILKEFHDKDTYVKYRNAITDKEFDKPLLPILKALDQWYISNEASPSVEDTSIVLGKVCLEDALKLKDTFSLLAKLPKVDGFEHILESYKRRYVLEQISVLSYDLSVGKGKYETLEKLFKDLAQPTLEVIEYVTDDLDELLASTVEKVGLRWRLAFLNRSLGSLRPGDFGFTFARPETGKTTFLASEVTHMAQQAKEQGLGPVIWINNEEQGAKVKLRLWQAALGTTQQWIRENREKAREGYLTNIGSHLRLIDKTPVSAKYIEKVVVTEKPSLVIIDQIDKVQGFQADREDLQMGAIYIWAREVAKSGLPLIGVCQASTEAEGVKWLYMDHVAKAKTAKQAEADWVLGIGKTRDPGFDYIRYLNISKNKLSGDLDSDPSLRHGQGEVLIRPEIARYEDL